MFIENGSPNAVMASSNETVWSLRFDAAFSGSHSKLYSTCVFYRPARTDPHGMASPHQRRRARDRISAVDSIALACGLTGRSEV